MIFVDDAEAKYPERLLSKRYMTEGNVIACLWKNPELYKDYKDLAMEDFLTEDGLFFFRFGQELHRLGYKVFDVIALSTYLNGKEEIEKAFNSKGGFQAVKEMIDIVNIENAEIYYDELIKSNILLKLFDKGFDVLSGIDKFEIMTLDEVYNWYDFQLNNIFVKKQIQIKPVDLTTGYDDFLDEANAGANLGTLFNSSCPLLSYQFSGIHKQTMLLHTAHSGVGKTSSAIVFYILPLLEQGKKICIIANEQGEKEWRNMLLPSVLGNRFYMKGVARQRLMYGNFTKDEWENLELAKKWLGKYKGNLEFVQLYDYSISTIKKIVGKYAKQGFETFIYDTAKPEDESSDKSWANFTEDSKQLFQIANKDDIALICTAQLSGSTIGKRYLDGSCLAKSKSIKEVASQIVMIRDLWADEYTGEQHDVKAYKFDPLSDGSWSKTKTFLDLKKDDRYSIVFIDKNRFGKDRIQLIYKKNLDYNNWHELGYCYVKEGY